MENCTCVKPYLINYTVYDYDTFVGVAIASAKGPTEAKNIFLADSNFNGYRSKIKVKGIQEVPQGYFPNLDVEAYMRANALEVLALNGIIPVEGKSAYQVAVDNGFEGTQDDWLLSLKGEKGDKGDTGDSGVGKATLEGGEIFNNYEGENTNIASGPYSHAEGYNTRASGTGSHAEGYGDYLIVDASGEFSHAEGCDTRASDYYAHAEGNFTIASKIASHAEGCGTKADGDCSHTEGNETRAYNYTEHAQGTYNQSNPNTIDSVGIGTGEEDRKNAEETTTDGKKYILNVGDYNGKNPSNTNDVATVISNKLNSSDAVGKKTAEGGEIFNWYEGDNTDPANSATGEQSHAEGRKTISSGKFSHTEGYDTTASGETSHAEGLNTTASGDYGSHAEGTFVKAFGNSSHAEGESTTAGAWKHKTSGTIIYNEPAESEKMNYTKIGRASHAEGIGTITSGNYSHSEGSETKCSVNSGHVEGIHTKASNTPGEHAQGVWNKSNLTTIDSIGIGTEESKRKNAVETMITGDHYIINVGTYDGTNPDKSNSLQAYLKSLEDRIVALEATK